MSEEDTGSEATISVETELDTLRAGVDDPQVLREQLNKEAQARRQLTARAIKAEESAKTERAARIKAEELQSPTNSQSSSEQEPVTLNDEVVDLRLDGYSKKEVEWIMKNGGRKVLEDQNSLVSIAIKAQREQAKAEAAASSVADTTGMSEIERRYTPDQLRNMSVKELEKILPHADS